MNLSKRILTLSFILVSCLIVLSTYSIYNISKLSNQTDALKENVINQILVATEMKIAVIQVQQWLTDISATRGAAGYDDGHKEAEDWATTYRTKSAYLKKVTQTNSALVNQITELDKSFEDFYKMGKEMSLVYIKDGPAEGNKFMEKFDPYAEKITNQLEELNKAVVSPIQVNFDFIAKLTESTEKNLNIITAIAFLLSSLAAYFILKSIKKKINGNLEKINQCTSSVNQSAQNNLDLSNQLASSVSQQSASVQEISATSEELTQTSKKNTEIVDDVTNLAKEQNNSTQKIISSTDIVVEKIENLDNQLVTFSDVSTENAKKLEELLIVFKTLSEKLKIIDDIVFQTKLLSFNASVEASRAGEHGKGFAVVAEEIGKLATHSGDAAKSIQIMISESSSKVETVVQSSVESINFEMSKSKKFISSIKDDIIQLKDSNLIFLSKFQESFNLLAQVEESSKEQFQGLSQLNLALNQIESSNNSNSHVCKETNVLSKNLSVKIQELNQSLADIRNFIN